MNRRDPPTMALLEHDRYNLQMSASQICLNVELPGTHELRVLDGPRERWSDVRAAHDLIWIAGGGAYILDDRFLTMVRRSSNAPSNPNKLTIGTGLADSLDELYDPKLLLRELFEEILLFDRHGNSLIPEFAAPFTHLTRLAATSIGQTLEEIGGGIDSQILYTAELMQECMNDTVIVKGPSVTHTIKCILHVDPNNGAVNMMFPVSMRSTGEISSMNFRDGESITDGLTAIKPSNRPIVLLDLKTMEAIDLKSGLHTKMDDYSMVTPQAKKFIHILLQNRKSNG